MGLLWSSTSKISTSIEERLRSITREHLTDFSFNGISTVAKVVSVYDGDTCRIAFGYPPNDDDAEIIMIQCCLNRIKSPKVKTRNKEEKLRGFKAKKHLKEKVMNEGQLVYVYFNENDSFRRPFVDIYINEEDVGTFGMSVNNRMVIEKNATFYNGDGY